MMIWVIIAKFCLIWECLWCCSQWSDPPPLISDSQKPTTPRHDNYLLFTSMKKVWYASVEWLVWSAHTVSKRFHLRFTLTEVCAFVINPSRKTEPVHVHTIQYYVCWTRSEIGSNFTLCNKLMRVGLMLVADYGNVLSSWYVCYRSAAIVTAIKNIRASARMENLPGHGFGWPMPISCFGSKQMWRTSIIISIDFSTIINFLKKCLGPNPLPNDIFV